MAKFRLDKPGFNGGQLSASGLSRTDLNSYKYSCKKLKNLLPLFAGGAYKRPGTIAVTSVPSDGWRGGACIPFVYSADETYGGFILATSATGSAPVFVRATDRIGGFGSATTIGALPYRPANSNNGLEYDEWHDVQWLQVGDFLWLVHPDYPPYIIRRTAQDSFTCNIFSKDSGGTLLTGQSFTNAWPFLNMNSTAVTLSPAATSGTNINMTSSAAFFNASHAPSSAGAGDGAVFKIKHGSTYGVAQVRTYNSSTSVQVDIIQNFGATSASADFWESAWSHYRGWPGTITKYQERIAYGGTDYEPDTIYFSKTSNYLVMQHNELTNTHSAGTGSAVSPYSGPAGSDAFAATLDSNQLNRITWMVPFQDLLVGTQRAEYTIRESNGTEVFGKDTITAKPISQHGSARHQPQVAGSEVLCLSQSRDELYALSYSLEYNSFTKARIQGLFNEFPKIDRYGRRKVRRFQWDGTRNLIWMCDTAGNWLSCLRDKSTNVAAWSEHELGGYDADDAGTLTALADGYTYKDPYVLNPLGSVISIVVVPNSELDIDDLWMIVKREDDTGIVYSFEVLQGGEPPYETAYFMDSGVVAGYSGALSFGQVFTDGSRIIEVASGDPAPTPASWEGPSGSFSSTVFNEHGIFAAGATAVAGGPGTITVAAPYPTGMSGGLNSAAIAHTIVLGYSFTADLIPVRPDLGSQIGSANQAVKRTHDLHVGFYKTLAAKVGSDPDNLETIVFRTSSTAMGDSAELFTGFKRVKLDADYDRDGYVLVRSDSPLPFALTSLVFEGITYD